MYRRPCKMRIESGWFGEWARKRRNNFVLSSIIAPSIVTYIHIHYTYSSSYYWTGTVKCSILQYRVFLFVLYITEYFLQHILWYIKRIKRSKVRNRRMENTSGDYLLRDAKTLAITGGVRIKETWISGCWFLQHSTVGYCHPWN